MEKKNKAKKLSNKCKGHFSKNFFILKLIVCVCACACVCVYLCVCAHTCGVCAPVGRVASFFPSAVPRIGLRSSGLAAGTVTCRATSLVWLFLLFCCLFCFFRTGSHYTAQAGLKLTENLLSLLLEGLGLQACDSRPEFIGLIAKF